MGVVLLVSGVSGVGKSTLTAAMANVLSNVTVLNYGQVLLSRARVAKPGISHDAVRLAPAEVFAVRDISWADREIVRRTRELKIASSVLIELHPAVRTTFGYRAAPYRPSVLRTLKPDGILHLFAADDVLRKRHSERETATEHVDSGMLARLQEQMMVGYAISAGCPVFFVDTGADFRKVLAAALVCVRDLMGQPPGDVLHAET